MVDDGDPGRLYIVSTPIGNMGDFSFRAVEILKQVSVVLAEDTRHSLPLLQRYAIETPLESYHEHKEARATPRVLERLRRGESVALISDAGTPLVSDPGARLVTAAIEAGIEVVPVPGASALLAALVGSGLDAEQFTFFGFLPRKGRERSDAIAEIAGLRHTAVLYEAPARVGKTLAELAEAAGGNRKAVVAREVTKRYEEFRRGTLAELATYYSTSALRGEAVILVSAAEPAQASEREMRERAVAMRSAGATARDITAALVAEFGAPRNLAYRLAHEE